MYLWNGIVPSIRRTSLNFILISSWQHFCRLVSLTLKSGAIPFGTLQRIPLQLCTDQMKLPCLCKTSLCLYISCFFLILGQVRYSTFQNSRPLLSIRSRTLNDGRTSCNGLQHQGQNGMLNVEFFVLFLRITNLIPLVLFHPSNIVSKHNNDIEYYKKKLFVL